MLTKVGLGTFVDPDLQGCAMNEAGAERPVEVELDPAEPEPGVAEAARQAELLGRLEVRDVEVGGEAEGEAPRSPRGLLGAEGVRSDDVVRAGDPEPGGAGPTWVSSSCRNNRT